MVETTLLMRYVNLISQNLIEKLQPIQRDPVTFGTSQLAFRIHYKLRMMIQMARNSYWCDELLINTTHFH